jgi:hypothetical protein
MDEQMTMAIMETMAQMFETLVSRIEMLERRLDEAHQCSCAQRKEWINDLEPKAVFSPADDFLSQEQMNRILAEGSE